VKLHSTFEIPLLRLCEKPAYNTRDYCSSTNKMTTRNEESSPSYGADPVAYLEAIASSAPSKELLSRVAGPVASSMKEEATAGIAPLYLRAAAQQLAAEMATARAPVLAAAASAAGTTAAAAAQVDVEAEMKAVQQIYEIAEVRDDWCVTLCLRYVTLCCVVLESYHVISFISYSTKLSPILLLVRSHDVIDYSRKTIHPFGFFSASCPSGHWTRSNALHTTLHHFTVWNLVRHGEPLVIQHVSHYQCEYIVQCARGILASLFVRGTIPIRRTHYWEPLAASQRYRVGPTSSAVFLHSRNHSYGMQQLENGGSLFLDLSLGAGRDRFGCGCGRVEKDGAVQVSYPV
jgi:hypothetical protein